MITINNINNNADKANCLSLRLAKTRVSKTRLVERIMSFQDQSQIAFDTQMEKQRYTLFCAQCSKLTFRTKKHFDDCIKKTQRITIDHGLIRSVETITGKAFTLTSNLDLLFLFANHELYQVVYR